jgi:hypothetical protein
VFTHARKHYILADTLGSRKNRKFSFEVTSRLCVDELSTGTAPVARKKSSSVHIDHFLQRAGLNVINFYRRNLLVFVISLSVCPFKPFKPSLMFVGTVEAYSIEKPFRCSTLG